MRRTRAFFTSQNASSFFNGRWEWKWREPIVDIISLKIKKVVIHNTLNVLTSPWIFLRTDCIPLTRATHLLNGQPTQVVALIPNNTQGGATTVFMEEEDDSESFSSLSTLHNLWFELLDSSGNVLNPVDLLWQGFCIEIQMVVKVGDEH